MANGGVFSLITNVGQQDKLIMSTAHLSKRIEEIRQENTKAGKRNVDPKLSDLEKSHVLFMNAHFKPFVAMAYQYDKIALSNATLGSEQQFNIPNSGDFFHDMVLHVVMEAPTASLTVTGAAADSDVALYRWCDWIGERLCDRVAFDVNGNALDSYTSDSYTMHRQFCVGKDKLTAWARNMGQEEKKDAYYNYSTAGSGTPASSRGVVSILDGHQTYKQTHGDVELFIPILFWFNTDAALSIPSVAIPFGQRYITVNLTSKENLLRAIINPSAVSSTISAPTVTTPSIRTFTLYMNSIFVQPDIHDIYIKRIGFNLVRVHRRQSTNLNKSSDRVHLQSLKWPIETLYLGVQPVANITKNTTVEATGSSDSVSDPLMENWHRYGQVSDSTVAANVTNGVTSAYTLKQEKSHITKITIDAHGEALYSGLPAQFFNSYVPYHYGGWKIVAPTDPGLYMITFNLYPGAYQPSGHINLSRAREFYFEYESTYITSSTPATLIVNGVAINFIMFTDGSAIMRYTT